MEREHRHAARATPYLRRELEPGQNEFPLILHGANDSGEGPP
jgi:hypothetical protein